VRAILRLVEKHFHINPWFDLNRGDRLDHFSGGDQVQDTLVDAHFVAIKRVGSVAARRLANGQGQALRGDADGALDALGVQLVNSAALEVSANL